MPQRCVKSPRLTESAAFTSPTTLPGAAYCPGNDSSAEGKSARYSGFPTRKASRCGGLAPRMSSQKLSRWPRPFSALINTRSYKSALQKERASPMSTAQSTSIPSFRITSARKSRFACEASIRRTRFFFAAASPEDGKAIRGVFTRTPTRAEYGSNYPLTCVASLPDSPARGFVSGERSSACVPGGIWLCHHLLRT